MQIQISLWYNATAKVLPKLVRGVQVALLRTKKGGVVMYMVDLRNRWSTFGKVLYMSRLDQADLRMMSSLTFPRTDRLTVRLQPIMIFLVFVIWSAGHAYGQQKSMWTLKYYLLYFTFFCGIEVSEEESTRQLRWTLARMAQDQLGVEMSAVRMLSQLHVGKGEICEQDRRSWPCTSEDQLPTIVKRVLYDSSSQRRPRE